MYTEEFLKDMDIRIGKLIWYPLIQVLIYGPAAFADFFVNTMAVSIYEVLLIWYPANGIVNTMLFLYVRNISIKTPNEMREALRNRESSHVEISMNNLKRGSVNVTNNSILEGPIENDEVTEKEL